MGIADLQRLHPVYRFANDFCKLMKFDFSFKEDSGNFETAVIFSQTTSAARLPNRYDAWETLQGEILLCPDIVDFANHIIIEIEEESKPQKGPKIIKKGHWEESKRDTRRDSYYKLAGFFVLKIWEWQLKSGVWRIMVVQFLIECYQRIEIRKTFGIKK